MAQPMGQGTLGPLNDGSQGRTDAGDIRPLAGGLEPSLNGGTRLMASIPAVPLVV
jgi:hypothetical protein